MFDRILRYLKRQTAPHSSRACSCRNLQSCSQRWGSVESGWTPLNTHWQQCIAIGRVRMNEHLNVANYAHYTLQQHLNIANNEYYYYYYSDNWRGIYDTECLKCWY